MVEFRLEIIGAAYREGLFDLLKQFSPRAQVNFIDREGRAIAHATQLLDMMVTVATLVQITGGLYPTYQGIRLLIAFADGIRAKYPSAPPITLRIIDGETQDIIELEGAS